MSCVKPGLRPCTSYPWQRVCTKRSSARLTRVDVACACWLQTATDTNELTKVFNTLVVNQGEGGGEGMLTLEALEKAFAVRPAAAAAAVPLWTVAWAMQPCMHGACRQDKPTNAMHVHVRRAGCAGL